MQVKRCQNNPARLVVAATLHSRAGWRLRLAVSLIGGVQAVLVPGTNMPVPSELLQGNRSLDQ